MFDSNQFFGVSAAGAFYPTTIDQSLRFNFDDNPYLTKTTGAGNRRTYTISLWFKMGYTGVREQSLFSSWNSGGYVDLTVGAYTGVLEFYLYPSYVFRTYRVLRDPSAWYHVVVSVDTTQATASERVKMWLNGEQQTGSLLEYEQQPTQNYDTNMGVASSIVDVGAYYNTPLQEFDGYIAEVHFTDGTAYDADTFGELKSGIWIPKAPSVTYGTNGFKLTFEDSAAIGDDTSGNGNDFTVNNLVASDVVPDSPTNNFAVMNPLHANASGTASEGNLRYAAPASNWYPILSSFAVSSGKWYAEFYWDRNSGLYSFVGIATQKFKASSTTFLGESSASSGDPDALGYHSNTGNVYKDGSAPSYGDAWATGGAIIGIALDMDNGAVWFSKDGTWQNSATLSEIEAGTTTNAAETGLDDTYYIGFTPFGNTGAMIANFGQDSTFAGNETAGGNSDDNGIGDFAYTVPSGFLALCTSNLPDPVIDPAQDDTPEDYFNTVLYTGNGSTQSITGVGFQPDWTWIKRRDGTTSHNLFDSVRGAGNPLFPDLTNAEASDGRLTSFDSDGFSLDSDTAVNASGASQVAWNWKASGTGVSNTNGSITSTVSANTDAGFSIASWTATTGTQTVGHGLDSTPEMVIMKNRTDSANWAVFHTVTGSHQLNYLNLTNAAITPAETGPTSTVFTVGQTSNTTGTSGDDMIAYCFHSVDGFSKVGSYEGNNSTNGTFVYTGFRPKWVLIKHADSTGNWTIFDAERSTYNLVDDQLLTNLGNAEKVQAGVDFLSNGFKLRVSGVADFNNTDTYIYLAFAEQPVKYSNAR